MSNLCFWICVLIIHCAILCNEVSETHSIKDSLTSDVKKQEADGNKVNMHKFHPFLKNVVLSDDMVSLLDGLKRTKRLTHHGLRRKTQTKFHVDNYRRNAFTKKIKKHRTPAVSINDVEGLDFSRSGKSKKRSISSSNNFRRRRKRIAHHGLKKKTSGGNKVQFSTCSCSTTEKMPSIDVHYLKTPITNRSRKYKPGSPSFLKRAGESPFVAVAKKLTQECSNMSEFSTDNYGFDSPLKLSFTRKYDTDKHRKLILKRDISTSVTNMAATETIATTILTTNAPTGSSSTADRPTSMAMQNQFSEIPEFKDFARSADNPESGGEAATNDTCDREVPCNMGDTLEEILQAVDEIAHEKSAKTAHEDFPCDVNGSWVTEAGGVRLDISVANNSQLHIAQYETVPLKTHPGFLCNDTWILNGTLPLSNSGIIMITGVNPHDKRVATFVGECRAYTKDLQIIWGHWITGEPTKADFESVLTHQVFFDIFVKLKRKITTTTKTSTTTTTTHSTLTATCSTTNTIYCAPNTSSISTTTCPTSATNSTTGSTGISTLSMSSSATTSTNTSTPSTNANTSIITYSTDTTGSATPSHSTIINSSSATTISTATPNEVISTTSVTHSNTTTTCLTHIPCTCENTATDGASRKNLPTPTGTTPLSTENLNASSYSSTERTFPHLPTRKRFVPTVPNIFKGLTVNIEKCIEDYLIATNKTKFEFPRHNFQTNFKPLTKQFVEDSLLFSTPQNIDGATIIPISIVDQRTLKYLTQDETAANNINFEIQKVTPRTIGVESNAANAGVVWGFNSTNDGNDLLRTSLEFFRANVTDLPAFIANLAFSTTTKPPTPNPALSALLVPNLNPGTDRTVIHKILLVETFTTPPVLAVTLLPMTTSLSATIFSPLNIVTATAPRLISDQLPVRNVLQDKIENAALFSPDYLKNVPIVTNYPTPADFQKPSNYPTIADSNKLVNYPTMLESTKPVYYLATSDPNKVANYPTEDHNKPVIYLTSDPNKLANYLTTVDLSKLPTNYPTNSNKPVIYPTVADTSKLGYSNLTKLVNYQPTLTELSKLGNNITASDLGKQSFYPTTVADASKLGYLLTSELNKLANYPTLITELSKVGNNITISDPGKQSFYPTTFTEFSKSGNSITTSDPNRQLFYPTTVDSSKLGNYPTTLDSSKLTNYLTSYPTSPSVLVNYPTSNPNANPITADPGNLATLGPGSMYISSNPPLLSTLSSAPINSGTSKENLQFTSSPNDFYSSLTPTPSTLLTNVTEKQARYIKDFPLLLPTENTRIFRIKKHKP